MYILSISLCGHSGFLLTIYYIKFLLTVLCTVAPIVLITVLMINLTKDMISGDDIRIKLYISKFLALAVIFLIPTVITTVLNIVGGKDSYVSCLKKANLKDIASAQAAEKAAREKAAEALYEKIDGAMNGALEDLPFSLPGDDLKYFNQGNYTDVMCDSSNQINNAGCGIVAMSMILTRFGNKKYNNPVKLLSLICDLKRKGLVNFVWSHGAYIPAPSTYDSTGLLNATGLQFQMLINPYESANYEGKKTKANQKDLSSEVAKYMQEAVIERNHAVLIIAPGHYVAVARHSSCGPDKPYYLYDPGYKNNLGCYDIKGLWLATYNINDRCVKQGICGWELVKEYWD